MRWGKQIQLYYRSNEVLQPGNIKMNHFCNEFLKSLLLSMFSLKSFSLQLLSALTVEPYHTFGYMQDRNGMLVHNIWLET